MAEVTLSLAVNSFDNLYNLHPIFGSFFPLHDLVLEHLSRNQVERPDFHSKVLVPRVFFISGIEATITYTTDDNGQLCGPAKIVGTMAPRYRSPPQIYPFSINAHFQNENLVGNYNFYYRSQSILGPEDEDNYQSYIFKNGEIMSLQTSIYLDVVEVCFRPNVNTVVVANLARSKYPTLEKFFTSWSVLRYSDNDSLDVWAEKIQTVMDFVDSKVHMVDTSE